MPPFRAWPLSGRLLGPLSVGLERTSGTKSLFAQLCSEVARFGVPDKLERACNRTAALARIPVPPEAHTLGALSAQLRRPRLWSTTSAIRRLATFNRPRRTSPIRSVLRSLCRLALVCGIVIPYRCLSYADNIPGRFRDGQRLEVARQRRHNGGCDVGHRQLPTIVDAGEARFRAIGEGVKQIAQLAAEQAFAELSRVPSGSRRARQAMVAAAGR
jgi:hypothetical protein